MSYRPAWEQQGYVCVCMRWANDNRLRPEDYDPLCVALQRGDDWFHGESLFGDPVFIRLADVALVEVVSAETVGRSDADDDERAAYKKTHGED